MNCVYVMLRVLGKPTPYEELRGRTKITDQGSSMEELARVAGLYGLPLTPMRATRESVARWPLPAIVHLHQSEGFTGHYVLYLGRDPATQKYMTLDCTSGELASRPEGDFFNHWSGYVLLRSSRWAGLLESWVPRAWVSLGVFLLGFGLMRWLGRDRVVGSVPAPAAEAT